MSFLHAYLCTCMLLYVTFSAMRPWNMWSVGIPCSRGRGNSLSSLYLSKIPCACAQHLISTSGLEQRETFWQVQVIKYQYIHKIAHHECSVKVKVLSTSTFPSLTKACLMRLCVVSVTYPAGKCAPANEDDADCSSSSCAYAHASTSATGAISLTTAVC